MATLAPSFSSALSNLMHSSAVSHTILAKCRLDAPTLLRSTPCKGFWGRSCPQRSVRLVDHSTSVVHFRCPSKGHGSWSAKRRLFAEREPKEQGRLEGGCCRAMSADATGCLPRTFGSILTAPSQYHLGNLDFYCKGLILRRQRFLSCW